VKADRRDGELKMDFGEALKADEARDRGWRPACARPPGLGYREAARYAPQVRRYLKVFGRENVRIIIFEEFKNGTAAVYRDTLRFLDVHPDFQPRFRVLNSNHRVRSRWVQRFLEHRPQVFRTLTHAVTTRRLRRLAGNCLLRLNVAYEPRPAVDPELRARLLKEVTPEVEELSGYWIVTLRTGARGK
jgi:hypothetical protein